MTAHRHRLLAFALLGLLTGTAYADSLHNGFVYDDHLLIAKNNLIRELGSLPTLFVSDWGSGTYPSIGRPGGVGPDRGSRGRI